MYGGGGGMHTCKQVCVCACSHVFVCVNVMNVPICRPL